MEVPADVLFHVAQHRIFSKDHSAGIRGVLPREDFKQGGFPAAVDPYQAHALAFLHLKRDILKDHFLPKTLLYVIYR